MGILWAFQRDPGNFRGPEISRRIPEVSRAFQGDSGEFQELSEVILKGVSRASEGGSNEVLVAFHEFVGDLSGL